MAQCLYYKPTVNERGSKLLRFDLLGTPLLRRRRLSRKQRCRG